MQKWIQIIILGSLCSTAFGADECLEAYKAGAARVAPRFMQVGGGASVATGLGLGILEYVSEGVSSAMLFGGTAVGTSGLSAANQSYFEGNVGQSILEAKAKVVGPYTGLLVTDLNDAIYETGSSRRDSGDSIGPIFNALDGATREQLYSLLNGKRITGQELMEATAALYASNGLCDLSGETLSRTHWAKLIVNYVVQKK